MKRILIAALLAALAAGTTLTTFAADAPAEKAPDAKKTQRPGGQPFRGTVKSFDKTSQSLVLEGEKAQTLLITSATRIVKDGKPATSEALTAGEMVMGFARPNADGKLEAVTLRVGKPTPRTPAPGEKPKQNEKKAN